MCECSVFVSQESSHLVRLVVVLSSALVMHAFQPKGCLSAAQLQIRYWQQVTCLCLRADSRYSGMHDSLGLCLAHQQGMQDRHGMAAEVMLTPLLCALQRFSNATPILEGVLDNYHMWKEIEEPTNVAAQ